MQSIGTLTADGNSSTFKTSGNAEITIWVKGDAGSGTLTLQARPVPGGTFAAFYDNEQLISWSTHLDGATKQDARLLDIPGGAEFRLNLASSTSPSVEIWVGGGGVSVD